MPNKLFYGDNLDILRKFVRDETVDLCYIDPPFNSKRNYNQIYNNIGQEDRAQAQAFVDTWTWDDHANECFDEILTNKNGVQTRAVNRAHQRFGESSRQRRVVRLSRFSKLKVNYDIRGFIQTNYRTNNGSFKLVISDCDLYRFDAL